jgi:hypothetical protein
MVMGFLSNLFSKPVVCQHEDLMALVNRLLDENKELQERLLPKPVVAVESYSTTEGDTKKADTEGDTKKADTVVGWKPPRKRVRDFIQSTNPADSLPMLSSADLEFLENSRG